MTEVLTPTDEIQRAFELGRRQWPKVSVDSRRFDSFVARACAPELERHAADLYLACGSAAGDRSACTIVVDRYLSSISDHLCRRGFSTDVAEEVSQTLAERLLTGENPRIGSYSGQVDLGAWIKVVAYRAAIDLVRANQADSGAKDRLTNELTVDPAPADPETVLMRADAGVLMRAAIEQATAALEPRERTLLRLYYVGGLSIDRLATMFHVHRATIARQIAEIRETVLKGVSTHLRKVNGLSASQRESFDALARSHVDLDLEDLLRSRAA
jgi:RNA polymerase sigma-70 factor (ECF subfamily)